MGNISINMLNICFLLFPMHIFLVTAQETNWEKYVLTITKYKMKKKIPNVKKKHGFYEGNLETKKWS